jgi:hypothetical protein
MVALSLFLLSLAPRLPGLNVFLTADEPKAWLGRSIQFLAAMAQTDWLATFDSPAPGVTTMWAGAIGLCLEYIRQGFPGGSITAFLATFPFDPLDPAALPLIRLPVVLATAAAAPLTYLWGRRLFGEKGAILTALFLALDPFLLALSRVLGHDALVAIFMWLSLLTFLRASHAYLTRFRNVDRQHASPKTDRRFLVLSGSLGGLAFLTKYPSLLLGAFVAGMMLVLLVVYRRSWQQALRDWAITMALWSVAAGLVFFILWPAMWVDPVGRGLAILTDALRASGSPHPKGSFFLGRVVPDPGPVFYLLVSLFRTTPVIWLGCLLLAVGMIKRFRGAHTDSVPAALILLAYAVVYVLMITIGGKKQDRYILPAFPALSALAALGYAKASDLKARSAHFKWVLPSVLFVQAAFVLSHYPYYFTYYNPLLGGGAAAARTMIVGWGEGLDQAAKWLNTLPDAQNLDVVAWYSTTFEPFFEGHAIYKVEEEKISRSAKPGVTADYVVFYINQVQRQLPSSGVLQYYQSMPAAYKVTLHGIDYAWIYPSIGVQHVIADEVRLVGQAELLGYDLNDEAGQPVTTVQPDRVFYLSLYWEWQGKAEDEPVGVSLVDADGVTRAWGNPIQAVAPLPFSQWQEGMIVRDDFALVIFADTPPGTYRLAAWIHRPATGETVGVFPTQDEVIVQTARRASE